MKLIAEGNYCVVMMQEEEAKALLSGEGNTAEVFFGKLRDRLGVQEVVVEQPTVELRLERLEQLLERTDVPATASRFDYLEQRINSVDELAGQKYSDIYERIGNLDDRMWSANDGLEAKLVKLAISQARSMPADWDGRCELGEAFTRVVELVYRNCRDGQFYYDEMGNRRYDDDGDDGE